MQSWAGWNILSLVVSFLYPFVFSFRWFFSLGLDWVFGWFLASWLVYTPFFLKLSYLTFAMKGERELG